MSRSTNFKLDVPGQERPGGTLPAMAHVLVLLTAAAPWSSAAIVAAHLAAAWRSALTGCLIDEELSAKCKEPTVLSLLYRRRVSPELPADAGDFAAFAALRGVHQTTWRRVGVDVVALLEHLGNWHGLVVMERTVVDRFGAMEDFGRALCQTRMPCLILPHVDTVQPRFEHVAIAWDGSDSATRAICSALPMLAIAREVSILDGSLHARWRRGVMPYFDPYLSLGSLGMRMHARMIHADTSAGAALLEESSMLGADLLVMGGFNHSRIRERVRGGASRFVLENATLPVWMQH